MNESRPKEKNHNIWRKLIDWPHKIATIYRDFQTLFLIVGLLLAGGIADILVFGLHISKWMIQPLTPRIIPINPLFFLLSIFVLSTLFFLIYKLIASNKYEHCYFPNSKIIVKRLKNPKNDIEKDMYFCAHCIIDKKPPLLNFIDEAIEDWHQCPNHKNCKTFIKTEKPLVKSYNEIISNYEPDKKTGILSHKKLSKEICPKCFYLHNKEIQLKEESKNNFKCVVCKEFYSYSKPFNPNDLDLGQDMTKVQN